MKPSYPLWALSIVLGSAACAPEFDPYNELGELRVLAVRAEPPELRAGETTTLDALIHDASKAGVTRAWSVCPWTSDPSAGYACPVDQPSFDRAFRNAQLEGDAPSLQLGSADTATLPFPGDADGARGLCRQLALLVSSSATAAPDCATRWEWTVRLVTTGDGKTIETVKAVTLWLTEDAVPNRNPILTGLQAQTGEGSLIELDGKVRPELRVNRDHTLRIALDHSSIETFRPSAVPGQRLPSATREALTFTWFVDAGSTERIRSTYKEGVESLAEATENAWHAPRKADDVRLYVVVRDHRGGIGWREGLVRLVD